MTVFGLVPIRAFAALLVLGVVVGVGVWTGATLGVETSLADAAQEIRRLSDSGEDERAIAAARALVAERESAFGKESAPVAEALEMLVLALARKHQGDIDGRAVRLSHAERALQIRLQQPTPDPEGIAQAWYMIGLVHNLAGDPQAAVEPFGTALRTLEAQFGERAPQTEIYLREYGAALFGAGRTASAQVAFESYHEVAIAKHGEGQPATFPAIYNLAIVYQQLGRLEQAADALNRAETVLTGEDGTSRKMSIRVRSERALVQILRGDLGGAVSALETVLEDAVVEYGPRAPVTAAIANNLAFALLDFGHAERAREALTRVLATGALAEQGAAALPPLWELKSRMNLARALHREGRMAEARAEFDRARGRGLEVIDADNTLWGEFHLHRAGFLVDLGEVAEAEREYELALQSLARRDIDPGLDRADVLAAAGRLDLQTGNAQRARERLTESLEVFERVAGEGHRWHEVREDLAKTYWALDSREAAFETAVVAARGSIAYDRATLGSLVERQALSRARRERVARDVAIAALLAGPAPGDWRRKAYELVIESRALAFDEMAARQRNWAMSADPAAAAGFRSWREAKRRYANLFMLGPGGDPHGYSRRLEDARLAVERAEARLAGRTPGGSHPASPDVEALQQRLQPTEALISFLRYERIDRSEDGAGYAAIVLSPDDDAPHWVELGTASEIEGSVESWRRRIAQPLTASADVETTRRLGMRLRRSIWDPIAALVPGRSRVFVVPDGQLHLVSLAALPGASGGYLIDEGPAIQYLTAERDLVFESESPANRDEARGLLIVSNPSYSQRLRSDPDDGGFASRASSCASFRSRRFGPLPGSRSEGEAVRAMWMSQDQGPYRLLTGAEATEAAVKRNAPGRRVLHFATHGFFLGEGCRTTQEENALPRRRGIGGLSKEESRPPQTGIVEDWVSPMLLSGLALAGANSRSEARGEPGAEDGILTAEEASALNLAGVELAVLSACDTGKGSVAEGEGLFGFRRALRLAGVQTVVANLWQVDDRFAEDWIERMYRARFVEGESMADAVRLASLRILNARREAGLDDHPFFWAGWTATGR